MKTTLKKQIAYPAYRQIRDIFSKARAQEWRAVNESMVDAYWNVIVEEAGA